MKLPYEEIIKMNAMLKTLPNFGGKTLEYLFRAVDEIEVIKEPEVCTFYHLADEEYNLTPNRFISEHEYEIFCKMLKTIIKK